jgi:HD-GYP domain-containing protein (c-di-GMP phosphodiesterase class II)
MDGTGYPNHLMGDAIPIAGRIIGLADVFEALTARDRPYKKAKSLAEAMHILRQMAQTGHIDPELYEIFESHQIHVRYAAAQLDPGRRLHANSRLEMGASATSRSARAAS